MVITMDYAESPKILTVEDDENFARILKLLLRKNFSGGVVVAEDCSSARAAYSSGNFNLITLDYQLPDGSGLELLEEFTESEEHPPVIMVTGEGDEETASKAIEHGVDGYVVKDHRLATILPMTVKRTLEKEEAKKALRFSDERYKSLFDNMLEGLAYCRMIFDNENRPVDWLYLETNKMFGLLTGLSDVVGKRISEVIPDMIETNPEVFEIYGRVSRTGIPEQFEVRVEKMSRDLLIKAFSPSDKHFVAIFENITERKDAERKLQHQYFTLQRIIESTDSLVFSVDTDYRYTSFNKAHADTMKEVYCVDIKIDGNILGYLKDTGEIAIAKKALDAALSGEPYFMEPFTLGRDTYWWNFDRRYNPITDDDGSVIGVAVIAHDVRAQKESEEMLADSLERLEEAQEDAELGFWKLDLLTMQLEWTSGFKRIYGLEPGSPTPTYKEFWDFVHPDDREFVKAQAAEHFYPMVGPLKFDYRIVTKTGNIKYIEQKVKQTLSDDGNVVKLSGSVQDVTDRKTAEKLHQERERLLSRIFENFRDVMLYLSVEPDGRYRFLSVNQAFLDVTRLSVSEVVGKYVDELITDPFLSDVISIYKQAIDSGETVRWEEYVYYPTGERYCDLSITPIYDFDGCVTNLVGSIHDITALKDTERELKRLNNELTGYAHTLSHDLKSPLSSAYLAFNMLRDAFEKGNVSEEKYDELKEVVSLGLKNTGNANALIEDLLFLAQTGEARDVYRINIEEIINDVLAENSDIIREIKLTVETVSPLEEVVASRTQIYRLFSNLIRNSIYHSRSNNTVIKISSSRGDGAAHGFLVCDNGAGIPDSILHKVFVPFVKEESSGMGIGLSIVEKIVKANGGEIRAYNNNGACFEFTLVDRE